MHLLVLTRLLGPTSGIPDYLPISAAQVHSELDFIRWPHIKDVGSERSGVVQ